jgi:putative NADH-flavin reductase
MGGEDMMKLLVLGATGGIGQEIVRQAAERNHQVTAFVRSPEGLKSIGARFEVIQGDPLSSGELARAIEDQDAILSGFGPRVPIAKTDSTLLHRFGVALSEAMRKVGIRRAIIVSTAFLFKDAIIPPTNLVGRLFFPNMVADASEMESFFQKSGLDWTLVRPPRLTNQPRRNRYRVREGHLPGFGFTISRADVAAFMIKAAENRAFVQQVVGISN